MASNDLIFKLIITNIYLYMFAYLSWMSVTYDKDVLGCLNFKLC